VIARPFEIFDSAPVPGQVFPMIEIPMAVEIGNNRMTVI
jgi:hypothetical protein